MKQCKSCSSKGFFLSLKNGLCPDCYKELQTLENTYDEIVDSIAADNFNIKEITSSLNKLIVKIRKFNTTSNSINENDCLRLLNTLSISAPNVNSNLSAPIPFQVNISENLLDNTTNNNSLSNNNISNIDIVKANNLYTPNVINNNVTTTKDMVNEKEENIEQTSENIIFNNSNLNNMNLLNDIHVTSSPSKAIEAVLEDEEKITFEEIKTITNPTISNSVYEEAAKLITSIQQSSDNLQDLAYYTLILKNTYLETLLSYHITEINNINVKDLIANTLNILAIKLKCSSNEVFSFFNYISIGIQTSGQHLPHSEILEISAQKIGYGKVIDTYHSYVNPLKTINTQTQKTTGISSDYVSNAPSIEIALKQLESFADGYKFVSYNMNFISSFINHYYSLYFGHDLITNSECLLKLYRTRYKNYYGEPTKKFDLNSVCHDILSPNEISELNNISSKSISFSTASYKVYENLKYRYK